MSSTANNEYNSNPDFASNRIKICREICPPPPDRIRYSAVEEHCLTLHIANLDRAELSLNNGKRRSSESYPGIFTFIPAQCSSEWLWEEEVELLEIYLPPSLLETTAIATYDKLPQQIELIDRFAIKDPFLEQLAFAVNAEFENSTINKLYLESLQTVLVTHLLRNHCSISIKSPSLSGGLSKIKLQQIVDYIYANIYRNLSLEELARIVKLSPYHFGELFKQSTGKSPYQYVLQCRIEQSQQLLADGKLSLAEISQAVGFCDQSHFTKTFRRYVGLTPRQYRQQL